MNKKLSREEKKEVKRVGVRLEAAIYEKTVVIAQKYGVSINTLLTFIIGSWVSSTSDLVDKIVANLDKETSTIDIQEVLKSELKK